MPSITYVKGLPTPASELNELGFTNLEMFPLTCLKSLPTLVGGIYFIRSVSTEKLYIGQSFHIRKRLYQHASDLKSGSHVNRYLVRHIQKYGLDDLVCGILEIVSKDEVLDRDYLKDIEQLWIDSFQPVFNLIPASRSCKGHKLSDETKKKLSIAHLGKKHSQEHKNNGALARARSFTIVSPKGELISGVNIAAFCRENSLDQSAICSVLRGDFFSYKGWKKNLDYYEKLSKCETIKAKTLGYLVDPTGTVYAVYNQSAFARSHNLNPSHVSAVLRGKLKSTKGFKL